VADTREQAAPATAAGEPEERTRGEGARGAASEDGLAALRGDCARCFGLCCVALPFSASADFAVDKPAGRPCANLCADFRCGVHGSLRERGFPGCTAYDCFGAGQQVSQVTFGGRSWRETPESASLMFEVFPIMQALHELLWYLTEALGLPRARPLHGEIRRARDTIERITRDEPGSLRGLDVTAHRREVGGLLQRVSAMVRAAAGGRPKDRRGADLIGADLRRADLRGTDLRGAYLLGADLRHADLRLADLLGADLRGADLSGADLTDGLFLTRPQVDAAKGDAATRLPPALTHPPHWPEHVAPAPPTASRPRRRAPRRR
jgi:hypothetical protein